MRFIALAITSLFIVACSSSKLTTETEYSGFLDDYSQLQEFKMKNGGIGLVWMHPELAERGYTKAILEPIVIYPQPRRSSDEARELQRKTLDYIDASIQEAASKNMIITSTPGPDTVRARFAIAGVDIDAKDLEAYEYVPVALLFVGAQTASGNRAQAVEVFFEAELTDSMTGEVMGRSVRKGFAEELENESEVLTFEKLIPQLDLWAQDAENIARHLKGEDVFGDL